MATVDRQIKDEERLMTIKGSKIISKASYKTHACLKTCRGQLHNKIPPNLKGSRPYMYAHVRHYELTLPCSRVSFNGCDLSSQGENMIKANTGKKQIQKK